MVYFHCNDHLCLAKGVVFVTMEYGIYYMYVYYMCIYPVHIMCIYPVHIICVYIPFILYMYIYIYWGAMDGSGVVRLIISEWFCDYHKSWYLEIVRSETAFNIKRPCLNPNKLYSFRLVLTGALWNTTMSYKFKRFWHQSFTFNRPP